MVQMVTDPFRVRAERDGNTSLEILLVADDAAYAARLHDALRRQAGGASIVVAAEDRLSVAIERARSGRWDVVVLDLSLPDSRGVASLMALSSAAPHLPIVVLTSADDQATAFAAISQGAQECLIKDADAGPSLYLSLIHI